MAKSRDINPARYNMDTIEAEVIEQLRRMPLAPSPDLEVPPGLRGVIPERAPALDDREGSLESLAQAPSDPTHQTLLGIGPADGSEPEESSAAPTEPGARQRRLPVAPAPAPASRKAIAAAALLAAGLLLTIWLVAKGSPKLPSAEGSPAATQPSLAEDPPRPDVEPAKPPPTVQPHEPELASPVREAPQPSAKHTARRAERTAPTAKLPESASTRRAVPPPASAVLEPSDPPRKSGREPDLEEPFLPE
jgi:hypothetical protein